MRNFSRLLAIGALIAATIGVAPAEAAKPEPPTPPTIDIDIAWDDPHDPDYPAAVCSPDFSFSVENIVVTGGELNDFNIHVARIGKVKPDVIAYEPTQKQEQ
ncbi:MAG: hypothetical protein V3U39_03615 [Acidimicrobiia bacterium]